MNFISELMKNLKNKFCRPTDHIFIGVILGNIVCFFRLMKNSYVSVCGEDASTQFYGSDTNLITQIQKLKLVNSINLV